MEFEVHRLLAVSGERGGFRRAVSLQSSTWVGAVMFVLLGGVANAGCPQGTPAVWTAPLFPTATLTWCVTGSYFYGRLGIYDLASLSGPVTCQGRKCPRRRGFLSVNVQAAGCGDPTWLTPMGRVSFAGSWKLARSLTRSRRRRVCSLKAIADNPPVEHDFLLGGTFAATFRCRHHGRPSTTITTTLSRVE